MENLPMVTKKALETLVSTIGVETATKADIAELANKVAENSANPLLAMVACKPLEEFITQLKGALKERALKVAQDMPESKRRIGNLTYNVISRKNYNFEESEVWRAVKNELKVMEDDIKVSESVTTTETTYMTVNIPKT